MSVNDFENIRTLKNDLCIVGYEFIFPLFLQDTNNVGHEWIVSVFIFQLYSRKEEQNEDTGSINSYRLACEK